MKRYSRTRYQTYEIRNLSIDPPKLAADKDGYTLFKDRADVDELLRSIPVVGKGKMGYLDATGNEYAVFVGETSDYEIALFSELVDE